MSNVKNYTKQGGETTVIGGELIIAKDGKITFDEGSKIDGTLIANQKASTATTVSALKDDLNSLIEKLKTSGLMGTDEIE